MPVSASDNRGNWRRGARDLKTTNSKRQRTPEDEEEVDNSDDDHDAVYADEDEDLHPNPKNNPNPNLRQPVPNPSAGPAVAPPATSARTGEDMLDGAVRISDLPAVVRRVVNGRHPFVVAAAAADGVRGKQSCFVMENVSYGQLQALSAVPAENAALAMAGDQEHQGLYVVKPPSIMEGSGVEKKFWNGRVHVLPMHADWFRPTKVHRLERQVVPRFFSGKSVDHTPEKYMDCRNMIVAKYLEHPEKTLLIGDCNGMAAGVEIEDMTRIFRFLEHWGIINYCSAVPDHEMWNAESFFREDVNGEVHVPSAALKPVDSLIKFDKPKCKMNAGKLHTSLSSKADDISDLEKSIQEKLSENCCNCCSKPLIMAHYQSTKEIDVMLCPDCYHENRFVVGHSSMDFMKAESLKDYGDADMDSWTDQETLLLLEAVELHNDNWNKIAEHVGSKSKAQCILHFLRLPVEDDLLSNLDVPRSAMMSTLLHEDANAGACLSSNGNSAGPSIQSSGLENRLPFANSENPVMSLVAFLASSVGPRVAAACAHASLAALSEDEGLSPSKTTLQANGSIDGDRTSSDNTPHGDVRDSGLYKEDDISAQASKSQNSSEVSSLSAKKVELAAEAGLAAAAFKAKLFADHEEREIQRLSANIINHQLKRLELKLKQFAEVETLLMKECDQVEKARQRFAADRARYLATRFGSSGVSSPASLPSAAPSMVNTNAITSSRPTQPGNSGYNQMNHPNMPFMPRQPAFSYGPRPPLSMIQTSSSSQSPNVMFGAQGSGQSSLSRPLTRPLSGTNSSLG